MSPKKILKSRRAWIAAAILLVAYIGVPAGFLAPRIQRHMSAQFGLHVRFESVWLGLRGIVISDLTCIWPARGVTLQVSRVILRPRPLRSLVDRRLVIASVHLKEPRVSIQDPEPSAHFEPGPGVGHPARIPGSIDLDVRDGELRIRRHGRTTTVHSIDGLFVRAPNKPARLEVRFDSKDLGSGEIAYTHGGPLAARISRLSLLRLTELFDIPHKLYGFVSTDLQTEQGSIVGGIKIEHLIWQGPSPRADTPDLMTFVSGLDADASLRARLSWPQLEVQKLDVTADGFKAVARGSVDIPGRQMDLDIECPDFRESQLESLSTHFWVLRHLNRFLGRVASPAPIQGRMTLSGPLHKPANWKYKGLVDIRLDTFAYKGFAGDYPFSGTVQFDTSGVFVPEVMIDFGGVPMKVYGTAADYLTRQTDIRFSGDQLNLARFLANHLGGLRLDGDPQGEGHVRLALQRHEEEWSLTGQVGLRRVKVPVSGYRAPLLAYGDIRFSGDRGDGSLRVRLDKLESTVTPFFDRLFTPEQESGFQLKADKMNLKPLGRAMSRPIPYVPSDGVADIDVRVFHRAGSERWEMSGQVDLADGTLAIPVFSVPARRVSGRLVLLGDAMRLSEVTGQLPGAAVRAQGASLPADPRRWSLQFHAPQLDLNEMLAAIRRAEPDARRRRVPYQVISNIYTDELDFHAFRIPGVSAQLRLEPQTVEVVSQTPFRSEYRSQFTDTEVASAYSAALEHYPLRDLFRESVSLSGDVSGSIALRSPRFADTNSVSGELDLTFGRLTFHGAPPFLQIINLLHLSLTPSIVFEPFEFRSPIRHGLVPVDLANRTNTGDLTLRGRLGLDAAFYPLDERDSGFHARLVPQGNLLTNILHEIKIFSALLTGQRQGVVLDFDLFGHYSKPGIRWREDPVGSIIRGWSRELLPGILQFGSPSGAGDDGPAADSNVHHQRPIPDEETEPVGASPEPEPDTGGRPGLSGPEPERHSPAPPADEPPAPHAP